MYEVDQPPATASACPTDPVRSVQLEDDRDYLIETATPGGTMARQGPELALGRLHPEFAQRLAGAIREARQAGLASAGIFSAYRPAAFGVGGFSDKFNSLHTYGLAVDMSGIGGPGSAEARLWYEIAVKHGVVCPYGLESRTEWNHCQPTRLKIILHANPLRDTVTAEGPISLETMFEAGNSVIESPERAAAPAPETSDFKLRMKVAATGRAESPNWCAHLHRPHKDVCGASSAQSERSNKSRMSALHQRGSSARQHRST